MPPTTVVGLEHHRVLPPFGQQVGRGQAAGARAGDDDGCFLGNGHEQGRLVDPPPALVEPGPGARAADAGAGERGANPRVTGARALRGPRC